MHYIFKNLKEFMIHEKVIFFIMVLCILSSSIVLNFCYGLYQNYHVRKTEATYELTEIKPEISEGYVLTKGQIQTYLKALRAESLSNTLVIHVSAELDEYDSDDYGTFHMRFNYYDHVYQISETTKEAYEKNGMLLSGRYLTNEEEASGAYVALVANDGSGWNIPTLNIQKSENTIELFGNTYEVVGEYDGGSGCPIVPFLTVPDSLEVNGFSISFQSNITRSVYEELVHTADAVLPGMLSFPDLQFPDTDSIYLYNNIMAISILIALLSGINLAILYLFMLKKRNKNLAIMRICGCTKWKATQIYLGECLLISAVVYAIGFTIFYALLKYVFQYVFVYMMDAYSPLIFTVIFLIYIVVVTIILCILIYHNVKKEIILEFKEGKV